MKWLQLGISFIPYLGQIVTSVESLFGPGTGAQKKSAALILSSNIASVIDTGLSKDLLAQTDVQDATSKLIDAIVAWQNVVAKAKAAAVPAKS